MEFTSSSFDSFVLAVIPARKGSKGLPGKNTMSIGGKPLLEYTLAALEESTAITHIIASTDDPVFAKQARMAGVPVIDRPAELAQDDSNVMDALKHAVDAFEASSSLRFSTVVCAEVTTPVRPPGLYQRLIDKLWDSGAAVCYDVCPAREIPDYMCTLEPDGRIKRLLPDKPAMNRQSVHKRWLISGGGVVFRRDVLGICDYLRCDSVAVCVESDTVLCIDTPEDVTKVRLALGVVD